MAWVQAGPEPSDDQVRSLLALHSQRRFAELAEQAGILLQTFPKAAIVWTFSGVAARALGHLDQAQAAFEQAEEIDPSDSGSPFNLALVHQDQYRWGEAMAAYDRALAIDPCFAQAYNNLGNLLTRQGEFAEAIKCCKQAVELEPGLPEMHNSLGSALRAAGRLDEAIRAFTAATQTGAPFASAHYNIAIARLEQGDPARAIPELRQTLALAPGHALAKAQLLHQLAAQCDWRRGLDDERTLAALGTTTQAIPPFQLLAREDAPERQLVRSVKWSQRIAPGVPPPAPARPATRPKRLRIGFFSGSFHDHPGMRLMGGMLRAFNRDRFELHAFSYGPRRDDPWRKAAEQSFDHFHDVFGWPDDAILERARSVPIDIALDRQGHTTGSRTAILHQRAAPVQINYVAYPSTMGASYIDYIMADPVVIPDSEREHYSESVIRLPGAYMATDNTLPISDAQTSRADHGLPQAAMVLCCFNTAYKLQKREYSIWIRVLANTPEVVLWLMDPGPEAQANLRREAAARGVDPARLVFAPRLPNAQHLARHRHADLFVDTFHYGAHTTAVDALWTGLPVVTKAGRQFAARVGASLLRAINLPELITQSDAEYEALIGDLVNNPARLDELKARLAAHRSTTPLFDTHAYTRHFEAGLENAYHRWFEGKPPADITV